MRLPGDATRRGPARPRSLVDLSAPIPPDPEYVAARRILLNALAALADHGDAFIVVGAQAISLHTGSAELDQTAAPYTTNGDLAVNPSLLGDDPVLETAMTRAGFHLSAQPGGHVEPGIWTAQDKIYDVPYDVPFELGAQYPCLAGLVDGPQGALPEPTPCGQEGVVSDDVGPVGALRFKARTAEVAVDLARHGPERRLDVSDLVSILAEHDLTDNGLDVGV